MVPAVVEPALQGEEKQLNNYRELKEKHIWLINYWKDV